MKPKRRKASYHINRAYRFIQSDLPQRLLKEIRVCPGIINNPLIQTAAATRYKILTTLIEEGQLNFEELIRTKRASLVKAAAVGDPRLIALYIDQGCDVNEKNSDGQTPFIAALKHDHPRCAFVLQQAGAEVNVVDRSRHTPLDYAIECPLTTKQTMDWLNTLGAKTSKQITA